MFPIMQLFTRPVPSHNGTSLVSTPRVQPLNAEWAHKKEGSFSWNALMFENTTGINYDKQDFKNQMFYFTWVIYQKSIFNFPEKNII